MIHSGTKKAHPLDYPSPQAIHPNPAKAYFFELEHPSEISDHVAFPNPRLPFFFHF